MLVDRDGETTWCEGGAKGGEGETVTIRFAEPVLVESIGVGIPGLNMFETRPWARRPSSIDVTYDGKRTEKLIAAPDDSDVTAYPDAPFQTLTLVLRGVKAGRGPNACLADVTMPGIDIIVGVDAESIETAKQAAAAWTKAWSSCDAKALGGLIALPLTYVVAHPSQNTDSPDDVSKTSLTTAKEVLDACAKHPRTSSEGR